VRQIEVAVQSPLSIHDDLSAVIEAKPIAKNPLRAYVTRWLNRGLAPDRRIELRIVWPLWLIPIVLLNQLVAPHPVWVVFFIALCGFYILGLLWVRSQVGAIDLIRRRVGSVLVAGDPLHEEFEIKNDSALPLLWAEFGDDSTVPDYQVGRIVACEGNNTYRWHSEVICKLRGLFRLGPHYLRFQDPLGLFDVTIVNRGEEIVLIYPRVVQLPPIQLPKGDSQGGDRQRRPVLGNLPAATISEYQRGDSLRYVHWASTARRGRMMVKDLEIEPSGNIWLVLDLDRHVQQGEGQTGTFERGIIVTASLAAELLSGRDHRAVGLLAYGGDNAETGKSGLVQVLPGVGSAHIWPILSALAPVSEGDLPLASVLASGRDRVGRRSTLSVIAPMRSSMMESMEGPEAVSRIDWIAELVHLKGIGVACSVVLIGMVNEGSDSGSDGGTGIQEVLAQLDIPCTLIMAGAALPSILTFRRRRRIVRSTPTGGVVSYEVDEEVG